MGNIDILNYKGEKVDVFELPTKISSIKIKPGLVHFVATAKLSNLRKSTAHTKTRGEVRGGGRKPWRQKGTGRARAGSIRSPIWKGGGVIFGPRKTRNYYKKVNKKMARQALNMCLKDKLDNKKLVILENLNFEVKKTKEFVDILKHLPVWQKKLLIILSKKDNKLIKVARNISFIKLLRLNQLNILDLLKYEYLLMDKETFKEVLKQI